MPDSSPAAGGPPSRWRAAVRSPWPRLLALLALLAGAAAWVAVAQPQRHLSAGTPPAGFVLAYGLCAVAFVPRPLLNAAAGALLGVWTGTAAALAGTMLAAALSFGLGRALGRDALRPLWRGRVGAAFDRRLSRHGFRSVLAMRLFPGVPFPAATYCAAASGTGWSAFLLATALGSVPGTAAYTAAGAHAGDPSSPVFLAAAGFLAISAMAVPAAAYRLRRDRGRMAGPAAAPPHRL